MKEANLIHQCFFLAGALYIISKQGSSFGKWMALKYIRKHARPNEYVLVLDGDDTGTVNSYAASNNIIAYGGYGTVVASYNAGTGKTTVTAGSNVNVPSLSDLTLAEATSLRMAFIFVMVLAGTMVFSGSALNVGKRKVTA